jgi:hypothetical protein
VEEVQYFGPSRRPGGHVFNDKIGLRAIVRMHSQLGKPTSSSGTRELCYLCPPGCGPHASA